MLTMNCLFKIKLWFRVLLILYMISLPFVSSKLIDSNNENDINNGINTNNKNPEVGGSHFLIDLLSNAFRLLNLRKVVKDVQQGKSSSSACMSCKFGIAMAQHLIQFGKGKDEIAYIANYLCKTLNLETVRVCEGFVDQFKDEFVTVISRIKLSPNEICGTLLGESCSRVYNPLYNWTLPLTPIPKPVVKPSRPQFKLGSPKIKVLHISDTHIDPLYSEGADALCGEPLCCRSTSSKIRNRNRAGYWGDYRDCDIPVRTLEETLSFIKRTHKDLDYVIWTGDIPPHDVWNQTRDGQLSLIKLVGELVNKHLGDIPVYPTLGNHESAPLNSFPLPEISGKYSISWLYNTLEDVWSRWLPSDTLPLIKKGAYYSVKVKPGLKLISLNMNYCNNQNWWLLLNSTDPAGQLEWLIRELQASELTGEKVHIIGHIPPGSSDCLQVWSRNYYRIVNRFESTITGQFFGHTHQDEFQIFYDEDHSSNSVSHMRPTNVAYIGPSVTTFGNVNPGFRIYTIDGTHEGSSYQIVDHETYYMNLTEANLNRDTKPIEFVLSYSARNAYEMTDLTPNEWHNLVIKMKNDNNLFQKFYKFFFNKSDNVGESHCSGRICKRDILCRLVSALSHDKHFCKNFL